MYLDLSNIAQKIRKSPDLFAVTLSAAAQYMIYAAFNLYTFCKTNLMIGTELEYRWEDWKAVFKEAETIQNIEARNDALDAVVAMNMAEELYNS